MAVNEEAAEARGRLAFFQAVGREILARYRDAQDKMLACLAVQIDLEEHPPAADFWREALEDGIRSFEAADEALARLTLAFTGQVQDGDPTPHHGFTPSALKVDDVWLVVAPAATPDGRRYFAMITVLEDAPRWPTAT